MIKLSGNTSATITSIPVLFLLLVLVVIGSLFIGAYQIEASAVLKTLFSETTLTKDFLIFDIRLPRILMACLIGAGLAITGASIQGLFRNPLADPSLIGVTNGAMLFAVISIVSLSSILAQFAEIFHQVTVMIAAFIGGVVTTYIVYFLSRRNGTTSVMTMLMAGIAISAFASAISGLFINVSDNQELRDIVFWTLGSFAGSSWNRFYVTAPIIILGIFFLLRESQSLNAILLGEKEAQYLGVSVEAVKTRIILLTALVVGTSIAMTGIIGFIGLVIPHLLRLLSGTDYRYLLSASALTGAIFLVLADTLARTIIAPAELPIGILTAMIGAPFFLWLIIRSRSNKLII